MSLIRKITKCIELAKCPRKKRCQAYPMGEYASAANIYTKNCLCPTMQCTIGWMDLATSGRIKRKFQLGQTHSYIIRKVCYIIIKFEFKTALVSWCQTYFIYRTCTIITRFWFETALDYEPQIFGSKLKNFLVQYINCLEY